MASIVRVDALMVDLKPKVKRTDAIQSFVSQETPIVTVTDSDGATGTGYCYTIGTGGPSVMKLIERTLGPALIGRRAEEVERIWRDLLFLTHGTAVGAITALAQAAIDIALWDLRCRKAGLPLHIMAGGAQASVPLYTTEGGWLHLEPSVLVEDALRAKEDGFGGVKIKIGRPHVSEDMARLRGVRDACGPAFEIMTDANQLFTADEAIRRAPHYEGSTSPGSRSPSRRTISAAMRGWRAARASRSQSEKASTARCTFASICRPERAPSFRSTSRASAA